MRSPALDDFAGRCGGSYIGAGVCVAYGGRAGAGYIGALRHVEGYALADCERGQAIERRIERGVLVHFDVHGVLRRRLPPPTASVVPLGGRGVSNGCHVTATRTLRHREPHGRSRV